MSDDWDHEFNNIISEALNLQVFSYNDEVTNNVFGVIELLAKAKEADDSIFNTDIAKKLDLTPAHVELIQYLICNNDHAEYGTSPRGCWLTPKGYDLYKKLKAHRGERYEK